MFRKYINDFFSQLVLYDDYHNGHDYKGLLKAEIEVFLDNENPYNAYEIYRTFFMIYQITSENKSDKVTSESVVSEPNTLLNLIKIMKKYEEKTGDLIEKQRDHFVHSVNVFLLGLAIYSQNKPYRNAFKDYVFKSPYKKYYRIDDEISHEEFFYRWGIASLFHDIGYPVEIIGKQLKKFLNDSVKSISSRYDADTAIDFKDFNEFNTIIRIKPDFADNYTKHYPEAKFLNMFKPTDIMAHKISTDFHSVKADDVARHLERFINIMGDSGFIDHGFFSAILVMDSYGYLIQHYAKNHDFFFYPIVDSATAILLHNYYRNVLQKKPFNLPALHPKHSPIAYLLILCDELQEWNRSPFGVKDKKRTHINEMDILIDDTRLDVEYIVKDGAMGLGFSEDKEDLLRKVLSIPSIFKRGLSVLTTIDQEKNSISYSEIKDAAAPDVLMRNVESIARQIHQQYIDTTTRQYEEKLAKGELDDDLKQKYENLPTFEELSPQLKVANFRQARTISEKLTMIGCEIAKKSDEREEIKEFSEEETLDLAILEHDQWWEEKKGTGWTYGPERDDENMIHNYMVPWDELPAEIQQYDIDPVKNIPNLVNSVGLKIVRTRQRMLTFEMHRFYAQDNDTVAFDELPDYIKYSNYKQTDILIKILSELGYDMIGIENPGKAISSFNEDELDYLAKREHTEWYIYKVNLGWKYDVARDDELKLNPNLLDWEDLDYERQESNRNTFRNLPELCENIGLKIVKN